MRKFIIFLLALSIALVSSFMFIYAGDNVSGGIWSAKDIAESKMV